MSNYSGTPTRRDWRRPSNSRDPYSAPTNPPRWSEHLDALMSHTQNMLNAWKCSLWISEHFLLTGIIIIRLSCVRNLEKCVNQNTPPAHLAKPTFFIFINTLPAAFTHSSNLQKCFIKILERQVSGISDTFHSLTVDTQYTFPGRVSRALTPRASDPRPLAALATTRGCPRGPCPARPVWAAASASAQPRYIPTAATGCTATPRRTPGIDSKGEKQRRRFNKAWYF